VRLAFWRGRTAACETFTVTIGAAVTTYPRLVRDCAENVETIFVEGGFLKTEPDVETIS
jgi:hypothetical protein